MAKQDEVDVKTLPIAFHNGYVGWVIGAKQNTKKFPAEKIIRCIKQIKQPIVLLGGKEDEAIGNEILQATNGNIFNACGKFSLNQSASLVQQARLIITNDTGLMHIASAFKKPIIAVWGNTIPAFGMEPYATRHTNIEVQNLDCRPCSKLGYASCPKGHFKCMNLINEKTIEEVVSKTLN